MRICGNLPKVLGVTSRQRDVGKVGKTAQVESKKDQLSISSQAKDFQTVMKALRSVPDIREDKVKEISQKLESGEYNVSAQDISERIIQKISNREV